MTELRIAASPADSPGNPYARLLYQALAAEGVLAQPAELKPWRLKLPPDGPKVLHLHWPEGVLVGLGHGARHAAKATVAAGLLRLSVIRLKRAGVRIVWTAHNRRPNNPNAPRAQVALYPWIARVADAVIVHSAYAGHVVRQELGRNGPIYLAHHGNYSGEYPPSTRDRSSLRAQYGYRPGDRVLLAFGAVRAYKRLVELASDFREHADSETRLLIAGAASDPDCASRLRLAALRDSRITYDERRIPDAEVSGLYDLADIAVLNYREVFSSGALLLSLSLGLAALVPAHGSAEELVDAPAAFRWERTPFEALDRALSVPAEERRAAALAVAASYDWPRAAREHLRAYRGDEPGTI